MKKILITGCCGFIGQNLVKALGEKNYIIGIDNFYSSNREVLTRLNDVKNFLFIEDDIINIQKINEKIDIIFNLACPASPPKYQADPIFTMDTNYIGTKNILELARENNAIFIQSSTSEIYGDPEINPQNESYFGNVNPIGIRSCYDEGKRIAETLCYEYRKLYGLKTRIVRIFNTYGPGMDPQDGRVISNFMFNTIKNKDLEIYGDGSQTRSFCFIDDMIKALIKSMNSDFDFPINLGNDNEISLNKLAILFKKKFNSKKIIFSNPNQDDPKVRKPNIERAQTLLDWKPETSLNDGLDLTYNYFKSIQNEI
ncbi:GDP-mannose 4,6-dehydratase [Flavobacteriaceae bacterium]|nr:GDP-mannose 4,6-dehydratase [Flavobacteriaceae bacterium]